MNIIISIIIAVVFFFFGITLAVHSRGESSPVKEQLRQDSRIQVCELPARLQELSTLPGPDNTSMGAMCYDTAAVMMRSDYLCPVCGDKTIYNDYHTSDIEYSIPACRTIIKSISGLSLELDESSYCRKCSPDASDQFIRLIVHPENKDKPVISDRVTRFDLNLIKSYADLKKTGNGKADLKNFNVDSLSRIEELLGLEKGSLAGEASVPEMTPENTVDPGK